LKLLKFKKPPEIPEVPGTPSTEPLARSRHPLLARWRTSLNFIYGKIEKRTRHFLLDRDGMFREDPFGQPAWRCKMRKIIYFIFVLLFLSSLCFAQEAKQPKVVEVRAGKSFTISLESNATTGYAWQFAKPLDPNMLELKNEKYVTGNSKLVGSGGKQVWTLKALKPGKETIFLKYARSWEKDVPPVQEESFVIVIKEQQSH